MLCGAGLRSSPRALEVGLAGNGKARLGVDIGGTFTDVALEAQSGLFTTKVLTTSSAPEKGVIEAIRRVLADAGRRRPTSA